ncbi:MAG TPA: hypothetical protein EYH02_01555 [Ignisphaera aggregans]|uniref:Uncharacterized protein n=1 Tax=Ignisphaera aggregans TaxID=334771 RepID=A0A832YZQ2_9CREN|nr:hypothetical protein [Ignisphaera aggregans]
MDSKSECNALYERVREIVDIMALVMDCCVEFRKLVLPASKEWFSVKLPILIVNENGMVRAIEASVLFENGEQLTDLNAVLHNVDEAISKGNGYENQILNVEAVSL